MTQDLTVWTQASHDADSGMQVPIALMSFSRATPGKPPQEQHALYLSSIVFLYSVWENYTESVAVELVNILAEDIEADRVPEEVRTEIERQAKGSPWLLSVSPGWRSLWKEMVHQHALGNDANPSGEWGMNTASFQNVTKLFATLGIRDAVPQHIEAPTGVGVTPPPGISVKASGQVDVPNALKVLVRERGSAVHKGEVSDRLTKPVIKWWQEFLPGLYNETDKRARSQVQALLAQ